MPKCIRPCKEGTLIDIYVTPGSKKENITYDNLTGRIKVRIHEPARKGKANNSISKTFKDIMGECIIISGNQSKKKTILVTGKSPDDVKEMLKEQGVFIG